MQTDEFHVLAEYQVSGETHHGLSEGFVRASKHIQKSYSTGKGIFDLTLFVVIIHIFLHLLNGGGHAKIRYIFFHY